jgi:excisionase family DNA binding protein
MNESISAILSNAALTPTEVQRVLRSGKAAVYNSIKSGEIPSFRYGDSIRVPASWLKAKLGLTEAA